jgi:hypothetical protein
MESSSALQDTRLSCICIHHKSTRTSLTLHYYTTRRLLNLLLQLLVCMLELELQKLNLEMLVLHSLRVESFSGSAGSSSGSSGRGGGRLGCYIGLVRTRRRINDLDEVIIVRVGSPPSFGAGWSTRMSVAAEALFVCWRRGRHTTMAWV